MKTIKNFFIIEFDCIESTQVYLKENIRKINKNSVVIAKNQTSGIGRSNTNWMCFKGCLCFSISYSSKIKYNFQKHVLNVICDVLQKKYNIKAFIKWPNDVYIFSYKVCGVLIDRIDDYYIIGIGMNVTSKNETYKSIQELTGTKICNEQLIEDLLIALPQNEIQDYYKFGKNIYFENLTLVFKAVNDNILILNDDNLKEYRFDECKWSYDITSSRIVKKYYSL